MSEPVGSAEPGLLTKAGGGSQGRPSSPGKTQGDWPKGVLRAHWLRRRYVKFAQADWPGRLLLLRRAVSGYTLFVLSRALAALIGLPLLIFIRLLRPIIPVGIGRLQHERMHLLINTEYWLRCQAMGGNRARKISLFVCGPPANRQVLTMIMRRLSVWQTHSNLVLSAFALLVRYWPSHPAWIDLEETGTLSCRAFGIWNGAGPQLSFARVERQRGEKVLRSIGIGPGEPYICFFARDTAYLDLLHTYRSRDQWSYHDYRDCAISNYVPAAEFLAARGLWALRMGQVVEKPILSKQPRVVDYATRFRSDFADVYLMAHCRFYIGDTAGIYGLSAAFGVPCALANIVPFGLATRTSQDLFIPKKHRYLVSRRSVPFRDLIAMGADWWLRTEQFEAAGIEVVENTADEILALAQEMNARVEGTWVAQDEDEELQDRYRGLFPPGHPFTGCPSRVGAEFLRQNRELLV